VGLERGPLSLVSTIERILGRKSCGFGLENREYGRRDPSCFARGTSYLQKLSLTSPTSGGRSVGIVRYRTSIAFSLRCSTDNENKIKRVTVSQAMAIHSSCEILILDARQNCIDCTVVCVACVSPSVAMQSTKQYCSRSDVVLLGSLASAGCGCNLRTSGRWGGATLPYCTIWEVVSSKLLGPIPFFPITSLVRCDRVTNTWTSN
jgi:hypothetical protein